MYRLRQIAPLLAMILATSVIYIAFRYTPAWYISPPTFVVIILATGLSALTIIVHRRLGNWTALAAGLVAILLAVAMIYARTLGNNQGWPRWQYGIVTDLIRAMLASGGIFVLLGLATNWVDVITDRSPEQEDSDSQGASK